MATYSKPDSKGMKLWPASCPGITQERGLCGQAILSPMTRQDACFHETRCEPAGGTNCLKRQSPRGPPGGTVSSQQKGGIQAAQKQKGS